MLRRPAILLMILWTGSWAILWVYSLSQPDTTPAEMLAAGERWRIAPMVVRVVTVPEPDAEARRTAQAIIELEKSLEMQPASRGRTTITSSSDFLLFGIDRVSETRRLGNLRMTTPVRQGYWLAITPIMLAGLLPALISGILTVCKKTRAWNRQTQNQCASCGYDLRDSGTRCPECGHAADEECR